MDITVTSPMIDAYTAIKGQSVGAEMFLMWAELGVCEHAETLTGAVEAYEDPTVIELGVRTCVSTALFLAAIEENGSGRLWSVDVREPYGNAYPRLVGHPAWTLTVADDMTVVDQAPACQILFIDTSHTYEHTLAELEAYTPKVMPDGVILMHDTNCLYADDSGTEYPVRKAIDTFMAAHGEWKVDHSTDRYGLAVLWRG